METKFNNVGNKYYISRGQISEEEVIYSFPKDSNMTERLPDYLFHLP
jgi:hypothetical protein